MPINKTNSIKPVRTRTTPDSGRPTGAGKVEPLKRKLEPSGIRRLGSAPMSGRTKATRETR